MTDFKNVKKVTTHTLQEMKESGVKISMLTAYDFSMAKIVDEAGVDVEPRAGLLLDVDEARSLGDEDAVGDLHVMRHGRDGDRRR